jgi:hypothetical protein
MLIENTLNLIKKIGKSIKKTNHKLIYQFLIILYYFTSIL